jgi:hypothetical protein
MIPTNENGAHGLSAESGNRKPKHSYAKNVESATLDTAAGVTLVIHAAGTRAESYEVRIGGETPRTFNLRWQAESYYSRMVRRRTQKPQVLERALTLGEPVPSMRRKGRRTR